MIWKEEEEAELPTICGHSQTKYELCSTSTAYKFTNKKEIKAIALVKVLNSSRSIHIVQPSFGTFALLFGFWD